MNDAALSYEGLLYVETGENLVSFSKRRGHIRDIAYYVFASCINVAIETSTACGLPVRESNRNQYAPKSNSKSNLKKQAACYSGQGTSPRTDALPPVGQMPKAGADTKVTGPDWDRHRG